MKIKTKQKNWSEQEIQMANDLYVNKGMGVLEISKILNRSKTSVLVKIKRLKFRHTKEQTKIIKSKNTSGQNNPMYGKTSWSKGLTKENNPIIKLGGERISKARKIMFAKSILNNSGKHNPMYGRKSWSNGLTKETSEKLKNAGLKGSISLRNKWKALPEEDKEKIRRHMAFIGSRCKKKKTSIETKVENLLKELSIEYLCNFCYKRFSFDFYIPQKNSVIECQGDYWHCNPRKFNETNVNYIQKKNIERDSKKMVVLKQNNIHSLFLWEFDIKNKFDEVKNTIIEFLKK